MIRWEIPLSTTMTHAHHRFAIKELMLATALAAIPLTGYRTIGILTAVLLGLMGIALTLGHGATALLLMIAAVFAVTMYDPSIVSISLALGYAIVIGIAPVLIHTIFDARSKSKF